MSGFVQTAPQDYRYTALLPPNILPGPLFVYPHNTRNSKVYRISEYGTPYHRQTPRFQIATYISAVIPRVL